eukprot:scaffold2716_cov179-Amphora_coffeaeformis.AAC.17
MQLGTSKAFPWNGKESVHDQFRHGLTCIHRHGPPIGKEWKGTGKRNGIHQVVERCKLCLYDRSRKGK